MSLVTIDGESKTRQEWCDYYGITTSAVTRRMQRKGMSLVEAITYVKPETVRAAIAREFESREVPNTMMAEIPEFPGYYATEDGRIWNSRFRKFLHGYVNDDLPYERISPRDKTRYVHRLVCEAWHGTPDEDYNYVDHIDRDTTNNRKDNLRWTDAKGNADNRSDTVFAEYEGGTHRLQDILLRLGFEKYSSDYYRHFKRIKSGMSVEESLELG